MRCVTVQHFGSEKNYTFIADEKIKPGELLYVETKNGIQIVRALTSDFTVFDTDIDVMFGDKIPYKHVIAKYCAICGYRNSFNGVVDIGLPPGWISTSFDTPREPYEVLVHTKQDTFLAKYIDDTWKDSYTLDELIDVQEWLNLDIGVKRSHSNE